MFIKFKKVNGKNHLLIFYVIITIQRKTQIYNLYVNISVTSRHIDNSNTEKFKNHHSHNKLMVNFNKIS